MSKKGPEEQGEVSNGYEAKLWQTAETLRGSMDAAEYKHVVLGLIFLKYISDAFEEHREFLKLDPLADPEERDAYTANNIFWVPIESRWSNIRDRAKQPTIGRLIDDSMAEIESKNPSLKGILPNGYARPGLDSIRLGRLIDHISDIPFGDENSRSKDVLGNTYEYFMAQFGSAEGRKAGEFYTPRCVVKLLVEMLQPFQGRVYDPCCGSAGMFVQSVEFIEAHSTGNGNGGSARSDISIYGQESNHTTWRLAKMNLAIRGIDGQIAHGDTFHNDGFPDLRADYILANPPFNVSEWGGDRLRDDNRWQYGTPAEKNANYAWIQHIVHHLAPRGVAGFVLAVGSLSSQQNGENVIRKNLVEANALSCIVSLPANLFYTVTIPACLWFLANERTRRNEVLFIDARQLGHMLDRTHRELTPENIAKIAETYHAWRDGSVDYIDEPGFCHSGSLEEIRRHNHVLTPSSYVGMVSQEDDAEPLAEKLSRLAAALSVQQAEATRLDAKIAANLRELGHGE